MAAILRAIGAKLAGHEEKVTSALLMGALAVLGYRSSEQQEEIENLEARKASLRADNSAMSSTMWAWHEELFALAAAPSPPISASTLRAFFGEEDPTPPAASKQPGSNGEEESFSIL
uniref:Uncharacterized protein n=1 Tax=Leersia perrieri TaxID=77586 RepID=A0A0D9WLX9_9ORYZ